MLTMEGVCWLCHQSLKLSHQGICSFCLKGLPKMPVSCSRCALPCELPINECGRCLKSPPAWHQLITVTPYQAPLRKLIHCFKFNKQPQLAFSLARIFVLFWLTGYRHHQWQKPDLIMTIPLHRRRLWFRGFDHMALIGEILSRWLNIPYSQNSLLRSHDTLAQITLKREHRRANLKGAFTLETSVSGLHVAIIDDVITTGSTMNSAAKLLICAGAHTVDAWSLCRTL
ncbi:MULTISPECIES: phosphoribosyltransferase family protein [Providencia]|uniref:Phosphoribosyltransferase family protein n=3 Tax=Providencia TaxID=586 RepID=A0AA42FQL5_9GAMM|nr:MULTISPECIES: phosphoribosyltransferase family protein [Providencia]HCI94692.1 DNA utilization protein GntX [Providencia sp.]APC09979.1 DNA utilization protein GntX [Providencia rettgeri]AVL73627.1 DNA utilization protein GntX [Providencia rettgeri]EIL1981574.1 DNA utilization protein GntX [Providencia rettgeri]EIU9514207.1 DNA utilization protein GntX [Providencia rettgeri]